MKIGDPTYVQQLAARFKVVENIYNDTVYVGLAFQFKTPQQTVDAIEKTIKGYI